MGFWMFILVMELLMPLLLIGFGWAFRKHPPKRINSIYGYRTKMSMKNTETWDYAHRCFGKLWFWMGWLMFPVTILPMLFVFGKDEDVVGIVGSIIMTIQCVVLFLPIIFTEREMRRRFDPDGNRL